MKIKFIKWILWVYIFFLCFITPINSKSLISDTLPYNYKISDVLNQSQPSINLSKLPTIDYESLYYDWYHPKKEMLIIVPENESFMNVITPLVEWKIEKGVKTIALNNYSLYEGRDKAEKIRNLIKSFYEKENIQWVLLAGDATEDLIPTRYVYNPDVVEYGGSEYNGYNDNLKPTDFYYADLTGSWDEDGDVKWGESKKYNSNGRDEISWSPEVYVGRLPASTAEELEIMVNKTLRYENDPYIGDWMNRMLLAGGISSYSPAEDETRLTTHILQNYIPSTTNYSHLCEFTSSFTPPDPKEALTQAKFIDHFNTGYSTVFFVGHGNPFKFIRNPSNDLAYTSNNANACSNTNKNSLVYAFACTTSPFDMNDNNIGEILIKRKDSGAIGYIGGMRITWYFEHDTKLEKLNRGNAKLFWREFYVREKFQQGKALYESKVSYMNSNYFDDPSVSMNLEYERKNVLTYCLLGDPELDIYTNIPLKVKNPFLSEIYEGQNVSITIKNIYDEIVPNARISITSDNTLYRTFYADSDGHCNFVIPALGNKKYNVVITGHNIISSYFNFNTSIDNMEPEINNLFIKTKTTNSTTNIHFETNANDIYSGIDNVFLLLSKDGFKSYWIYPMEKYYQENDYLLVISLENLASGEYSYLALARDLANNTHIYYSEEFKFEVIERKNEDNKGVYSNFFIVTPILCLTIISIFGIYKKYRNLRAKEKERELIAIEIRKRERMDRLRKKKKVINKNLKRKKD